MLLPVPNYQYFLVRIDKAEQLKKRATNYANQLPFLGLRLIDEPDAAVVGCLVVGTEVDSPASKAIFNNGDLVTALNGQPTPSTSEFHAALSKCKPGELVELTYISRFTGPDKSIAPRLTKTLEVGSKVFTIENNVHQIDYRYNLQYGHVVAIGNEAGEKFPEVNVGDILLLHHTVEHKPSPEGLIFDNDWRCLEIDPATKDEYRLAREEHDVLGVLKKTDTGYYIIPHKDWVFCHPDIMPAQFQMVEGIWLPNKWRMDLEEMADKLTELKDYMESVASAAVLHEKTTELNYRQQEEIEKKIREINRERAELSNRMRMKHLIESSVVFINPATCEELQEEIEPGDKVVMDQYGLYPLELPGVSYALAKVSQIEYAIQSSNNNDSHDTSSNN